MNAPIQFRTARPEDGPALWRIAAESGVLDVNSPYHYTLLCSSHGDTCVVAELGDDVVGYITGFRPPRQAGVVFVWQIGVAAAARGQGVGRRLLDFLVDQPGCRGCDVLETTITPSNEASQGLFRSFARHRGAEVTVTKAHFGSAVLSPEPEREEHEAEDLYRIGPLHAAEAPGDALAVIEEVESEVRSYCRSFPTVFTRARGSHLVDQGGEDYLDFFAGAGALNYGHNPPELIAAAQRYLGEGGVLHGLDMATTAKARFLERFRDLILAPRGLGYKVQFPGPTGTNAVESALKLARKVTGREGVIAFTNAFHGMTLGSLAVTGNHFKRAGAGVPLDNATSMPYANFLGQDVESLDVLEAYLGGSSSGVDQPAAVIVETVQGEGGLNAASAEWLRRLERVCRRHEVLLIVDDIQAGCGRTGHFFSFEAAGIEPDMVTLSKSISGCGLPMALVLMRPEHDVWAPGEHNGTFRGNNLAFVTATEALERYWATPEFAGDVRRKGELVTRRLDALVVTYAELEPERRGRGLMQGLALPPTGLAGRVAQACFERKLILETSGPEDEVLKLLPPLTTPIEELERGLDIIDEAVAAAVAGANAEATEQAEVGA